MCSLVWNQLNGKVAGYGWPGRTANAVSLRGMRVRIPCLPLCRPGGEMDDHTSLLTRRSRFESWSGHSVCLRPRSVPDSHTTLRRSRTRFNSWRGHSLNNLTLEPDGTATGCNPVQVGSTPTGVFDLTGVPRTPYSIFALWLRHVHSSVMARLPRVVAPALPHHITHRGNRRQQTFFHDHNYQSDLDWRIFLERVIREEDSKILRARKLAAVPRKDVRSLGDATRLPLA
jgi:hypothetical protein